MIILGIITIFLLDIVITDGLIKDRLIDRSHWEVYYGFTIQNMMWVLFFIGLGELLYRFLDIVTINSGIKRKYLPEDDYSILESSDMSILSKDIREDAKVDGSLANFIKKLIMQFQTSQSIEQTLNMLNAQLEIESSKIDTRYNMIRYITWLIPTFGFIGTVMGIANALAYAGAVNGQGDKFVAELTARLAMAFDTTFVALVMSAILVFIMHLTQGREEKNLVLIGQYSLDNFINRLYIEKG
jgi:biopolymer transport protein ExbB/TolQ